MIHSGARRSLSFGYGPPAERRGILPLVIAALAATRAGVGMIQANQSRQRNKGYINANYRLADANLQTQQAATAQSRDESLSARGLLQGGQGSPITTALSQKTGVTEATSTPTDLASQDRTYTQVQFGREQGELDEQHTQALQENNAAYNESLITNALAGVSTGANLAAGNAGAPPPPAATPSPSMKLSDMSFGGIHPTDPIGHPDSAWYTGASSPGPVARPGTSVADFHV